MKRATVRNVEYTLIISPGYCKGGGNRNKSLDELISSSVCEAPPPKHTRSQETVSDKGLIGLIVLKTIFHGGSVVSLGQTE